MKKPLIALLATAALLTCSLSFTSAANAALDNYPYVKNGEIDLLGYFEMNGATAALKEESIDFTLTSETATVTFAKPLVADGFNFQWNAVEDSAKRLQSLAVTVTDSADAACSGVRSRYSSSWGSREWRRLHWGHRRRTSRWAMMATTESAMR